MALWAPASAKGETSSITASDLAMRAARLRLRTSATTANSVSASPMAPASSTAEMYPIAPPPRRAHVAAPHARFLAGPCRRGRAGDEYHAHRAPPLLLPAVLAVPPAPALAASYPNCS